MPQPGENLLRSKKMPFRKMRFRPANIAIEAMGQKWSAEMAAGRCVVLWMNFLQREGLL